MLSIVAFRLPLKCLENKNIVKRQKEHENTGSVLPSVFHMFHAEQKMDFQSCFFNENLI
jgi:hypothetical protein